MKYDTVEDIERELTDLEGLWRVITERHKAYYEHKQEMRDTFIILRHFYTDTLGNFGIMEKTRDNLHLSLAKVVSIRDLKKVLPDTYWSFGMVAPARHLPRPNEKCPTCFKGWTIDNAHEAVFYEDSLRHPECSRLLIEHDAFERFEALFIDAGFTPFVMTPEPNQYCSCHRCPPWFKVKTVQGEFEVGWRKRVIHIGWSNDNVPADLFKDQDVTKDTHLIHAWGYERAEEYLKKLREALT